MTQEVKLMSKPNDAQKDAIREQLRIAGNAVEIAGEMLALFPDEFVNQDKLSFILRDIDELGQEFLTN